MAILKIEVPAEMKMYPLTVSADKVGLLDEVAAFGFPLGDELGDNLKATKGAIEGTPNPGNEDMLLLDVNKGEPRSAVFTKRPRVAGWGIILANLIFPISPFKKIGCGMKKGSKR